MKIFCMDYGKAHIGCAVSDALGILAVPLETVHEKNFKIQLEKINKIISKTSPDLILFGLPKNMDGSEGDMAALVREFAEKLTALCGIPHEFIDERLSTVMAHGILNTVDMNGSKKRRNVVDTVSATILLQSYLDKQY